ncbi:hypothetical protein KBD45_03490 [Candidatus Dojkabacteria bacterium]|nr:hypothetical protein [Candidatus Dojkabacteria bacterium]
MKTHFCPNCHRRIEMPQMLKNPNFKMGGKIKLNCGNCNPDGKGNPKGVVIIKPKKEENAVQN